MRRKRGRSVLLESSNSELTQFFNSFNYIGKICLLFLNRSFIWHFLFTAVALSVTMLTHFTGYFRWCFLIRFWSVDLRSLPVNVSLGWENFLFFFFPWEEGQALAKPLPFLRKHLLEKRPLQQNSKIFPFFFLWPPLGWSLRTLLSSSICQVLGTHALV